MRLRHPDDESCGASRGNLWSCSGIRLAGIDGCAAAVLGGQDSEFGRSVFSRYGHGIGPYLDPAEPISREHIEREAERANVPAEKIDETIRCRSI